MKFTTGEIISAATGKLCCPIDGVYKILNFLTGDNLFTHQLPRAFHACKDHVQEQCPWTTELNMDECTPDNWVEWIAGAVGKYGVEHEISPLSGAWEHIDPIKEAVDMMGPDRVVTVQVA